MQAAGIAESEVRLGGDGDRDRWSGSWQVERQPTRSAPKRAGVVLTENHAGFGRSHRTAWPVAWQAWKCGRLAEQLQC